MAREGGREIERGSEGRREKGKEGYREWGREEGREGERKREKRFNLLSERWHCRDERVH